MSRIKQIIKNPYVYSVLSKMVFVLTGFLFTVFQSRFLGAEIKGQVAVVNSITGIAYIIVSLGIYESYPFYKRKYGNDILPVFLRLSLVMFVIYQAVAIIVSAVGNFSNTTNAALLLTPVIMYSTVICYYSLIENPNQKNRIDMLISVGELLVLVFLWIFARPGFFWGVFIIALKDVAKAVIFSFRWRSYFLKSNERSFIKWIPELVKFGFFPMIALLMSTLNYRLDVLMLKGHVTDAEIGIYSVGVLLAERVWMIPDAMKGVLTSNIAKGKTEKEVSFAIRICNTACLVLIVGLIVLGRPFILLCFGAEYAGAYEVTMILLAGVFAMIYYKLIAAFNISFGRQKINFVFLTASVLLNVVMNFLMIPRMGIYGAGLASVISYFACALAFTVYFLSISKESVLDILIIKKNDIAKLKSFIHRTKKRNAQ